MDLLGALEAVFGRTDPSGLRVYSEDLVSDFLPRIVLHALAAAPGTACPPGLVALVTAFVEKVGGAADDPAKTASAIEAYYARDRRFALLEAETAAVLRAHLASKGPAAQREALALVGQRLWRKPQERSAPPPAGCVSAGPMARFAVSSVVGRKS